MCLKLVLGGKWREVLRPLHTENTVLKTFHSVVAVMCFSHWWMWVWVMNSSHIQQLNWFKWQATYAGQCELVWLENLDGSCISHGTPALLFIKPSGNMERSTVWSTQDTGLCILSAARKVRFFWMTVILLISSVHGCMHSCLYSIRP